MSWALGCFPTQIRHVQVVLGDAVTSYEEQGSSGVKTKTPALSKSLDAVTVVPQSSSNVAATAALPDEEADSEESHR